MTDQIFAEWVILELMGHRRLAGFLTEIEIAGMGFLQLQIPATATDPSPLTQYYGPGSVYGITLVTEAMARAVAARLHPEPVHRWELPPAITPAEYATEVHAPQFAEDDGPF